MTVREQLDRDVRALMRAERYGKASFRTWRTEAHAVVCGRGASIEREVNVEFCRRAGIPIFRRPTGGGSVVVGPGTLQWALAAPLGLSAELATIDGAKRLANRIVLAGLDDGRLHADGSGDLVLSDRKVGGLALRRTRRAVLIHGTILVGEDLDLICRALREPSRQPSYRRNRSHRLFLANLEPFDVHTFERRARALLAALRPLPAGE
ncbi:MAG: hypothetical protein D6815_10720 [Candidatus Dadabacteria bacterium]|nr:MAG: hypothetical protein D6815_10720 [Candidatus Dadabacteria bacterium]